MTQLDAVSLAWERIQSAALAARRAAERYQSDEDAAIAERRAALVRENDARTARLQQEHKRALAEIDRAQAVAIAEATARLRALRGPTTSAWDDAFWSEFAPATELPHALRFGTIQLPPLGAIPSLVPLFAGVHLRATGPDDVALGRLLQAAALRALLGCPPGAVTLSLVDSVRLGADFAPFARLPSGLRGERIFTEPAEIQTELRRLTTHVGHLVQYRLGDRYATLADYNASQRALQVPNVLLVVLGTLPRADAELLGTLARSAERCGVQILMAHGAGPDARWLDEALAATPVSALRLSADGSGLWKDADFGEHAVVPDPLAPRGYEAWLDAIVAGLPDSTPALPFEDVEVPDAQQWQGTSAEGLVASVARDSRGDILELVLGRGLVHHALVGGMNRSGKTNLLHVLLVQLAPRYPPSELELYLIDLKEGVEFADYLAYALPHARVVALESEREFAVSALRHAHAKLAERRGLLAGYGNVTDYRRGTRAVLPRVLIVIDEFQLLFAEDDRITAEVASMLEDLVRRGAAFGVHVLLCSQSAPAKGALKGSIVNEMALRIALRCTVAVSSFVLGEDNRAAADLQVAGQAVFNDALGDKDHNVIGRIARLTMEGRRERLERIRALMRARGVPASRIYTFDRHAPARLDRCEELLGALAGPVPTHGEGLTVWLGEPIEIKSTTSATLSRDPGGNLLVVGEDEQAARGVLAAVIASALAQLEPQGRLLLLDFQRRRGGDAGSLALVAAALGGPVEVVDPRAAAAAVKALVGTLDARLGGAEDGPTIVFLVAGMHAWRELRSGDDYRPNELGKLLARLAEDGPSYGIHLVLWADSLPPLERAFKRSSSANHFDHRVVLHAGDRESNELLGSAAAAKLEPDRGYYRDDQLPTGRMEKMKPFALPDEVALACMQAKAARRA